MSGKDKFNQCEHIKCRRAQRVFVEGDDCVSFADPMYAEGRLLIKEKRPST
jgi:hypothetical protein